MPTLRAGGGPPTHTTTQLADYNIGCVVQSLGGLDSARATPLDNRDANLGIQIEFSGGAPCSETPPSPHPEVHPDEQSLPAEPRTLSTRLARRDIAEIAPRSRLHDLDGGNVDVRFECKSEEPAHCLWWRQ